MLKELTLWIILGIIGALLLFTMKMPEQLHSIGWLDLPLWLWQIHTICLSLIFSAIIMVSGEET